MTETVLIASAVILACSLILWGSHGYDDGIVGRAGLGILAFFQIVILAGVLVAGVEYEFLPEIAASHVGMALFLVFHVRKHLRLWTKERRCASIGALPTLKRAKVGTR